MRRGDSPINSLLRVDLSTERVTVEEIDTLEERYLGGLGTNTRLAYDLIPPGCDPLSPANVLLFGVGPLVGTLLPTASRTEVTAKSPLSGRFGTANAGGEWGPHLKRAGFSGIAILGRAKRPVYLLITDGEARILDASGLWGRDTWETVDAIREKHGSHFQVASIGPAGENLVRFASVQNNYFGAWGRTGIGAVMGSKNLKAVAVRGRGDVVVANRQSFTRVMHEGFRKVKGDASFGPFSRFGSMIVSDVLNDLGGLPGHNFTLGSLPNWEETHSRRAFERGYKIKDLACYACPIACCHWSRIREGEMAGYETKGLEVTFTVELGGKLGLKRVPDIFHCVEICNRTGMDVVSAAGSIALAIEGRQRGLLSAPGVEAVPDWGDGQGTATLLENIARRNGIGDLLAEGVMRLACRIPAVTELAMHIKGVEIPQRDPRMKFDVWTLGYLTNTRGGDSLRTRSPVEVVQGKFLSYLEEALGVPAEHVLAMDMPDPLKVDIFGDPPNRVDIPRMAVYAENLITIINCTGLCIRPPVLRSLGPDWFARALEAVTGRSYSPERILEAAGRVWNLQHGFNLREGEQAQEYRFPERFYREELPGAAGIRPPLSQNMVRETVKAYFAARGWDPETGQILNSVDLNTAL